MAVRQRRSTSGAREHGQPGLDRGDRERSLRAWSQHFEEITCPPGADEPIDPLDSVWDLFVMEGERLRGRVSGRARAEHRGRAGTSPLKRRRSRFSILARRLLPPLLADPASSAGERSLAPVPGPREAPCSKWGLRVCHPKSSS